MKNADTPAMACESIEKTTNSMGHGTKKVSYKGLTKREHFAGLAMQGLIAEGNNLSHLGGKGIPEYLAKASIEIADGLLAELDK